MKLSSMLVLIWVTEGFFTMTGAVRFLNSLPLERQLEAKIVATDFTRPVFVFYRVEEEKEINK